MGNLLSKLNGWKTYIVAIGGILTAVGTYMNGAIDIKTLLEAIWAGVIAMTVRHGITTTGTGAGK